MTVTEIAPPQLRHRRTLALIWLAAVCMTVLAWWLVYSLSSANRARALQEAERDLANLTRVSQEHASRTLRGADQVLRFIQSRYLEVGPRLDLASLSAKGVIDAEIFKQVGVIDANGSYILSNLAITGKLDLSDREHFKVHVGADTGELFVSKPVLGRASGKWPIALTRLISRANGDFAGVAVLCVDPDYFTRFYGELNLGPKGVHSLYGLDGVARARKVGAAESPGPAPTRQYEAGPVAASSPMLQSIAAGIFAGPFSLKSMVDGVERRYYFRKVPQYPLVVVAGLDEQDLLSAHRSATDALFVQAGIVTLLIVALALALTRHLGHIRSEMAARQLARGPLQEHTDQLNAIFALSPDGFVSFDQQRRVKYVNPAFAQMTAMGEARLEGLDEHGFSVWLSKGCSSAQPFSGVAALRSQVCGGNADAQELIEIDGRVKRTLQVGLRCSQASTVSQILYLRDVTRETEVDQMKSEFLSTAAHELRTPMASILGFSEILLNQELEAAGKREFLSIILDQSRL
ncbi:MAG: histidine kinase dimerization/phospho-acceptor domain-containing protein, partial [Betaproteobacteria bacterium]